VAGVTAAVNSDNVTNCHGVRERFNKVALEDVLVTA
jgi:hypothetical protein